MKRFVILYFMLFMSAFCALSQEKGGWSLERCINHAMEHNVGLKRQTLTKETKEITLHESRWAYSPNIYASGSSSMSTGRVLDQTTYEFIKNSTVGSSSASISGTITLFNGFRKAFTLQRAKIDVQSSITELESKRDEIKKQVAIAFLTLQCCESDLASALKAKSLIDNQIERISLLVETGRVTESDLIQAKAQAFSADTDVANAEGYLEMAKLELCQLLEIENTSSFFISQNEAVPIFPDSLCIFEDISSRPEFRSAVLAVEIAKKNIAIAQSAYYPTLSLSAGYGSSSSTARQKIIQNPDGTFRYEAYPFLEQYADNANSYISLGLTIPLFNGIATRNAVKKARITLVDSEYKLKEEQKKLTKEFNQCYVDCKTSYKKYLSAVQQLQYAEEAERQIREKYELGFVDFNTWNTSATELAKARYTLAEAKSSYIYNVTILKMLYS